MSESSAFLHASTSIGIGRSRPSFDRPVGASKLPGWCPCNRYNSCARGLGRHSRIMAALLRRIWMVISCFHLLTRLALVSVPAFLLARSAAYSKVRTTAECGRASLVQTNGLKAIPARCNSSKILQYFRNLPKNAAEVASLPAPPFSGLVTVTSRAADRPGRAADVRISAGRNDVPVSPGASVVRLGSASRRPSQVPGQRHNALAWLQQARRSHNATSPRPTAVRTCGTRLPHRE